MDRVVAHIHRNTTALQGAQFPFSLALNASNRDWFRFPIILNVFFFSMSVMPSQFEIRPSDPSMFTTIGPRWSSLIVVPPLLMSSCVLGLCGVSGSASGSVLEVELDLVEAVEVGSPSGFNSEYAVALILRDRSFGAVWIGRLSGPRCAKHRTRDCMCTGERSCGCWRSVALGRKRCSRLATTRDNFYEASSLARLNLSNLKQAPRTRLLEFDVLTFRAIDSRNGA
jgi:hypothetical protein